MSGQMFTAVSFITFENSSEMHFCSGKQQCPSQGWIFHCMWISLKWSTGALLSPWWSQLQVTSPKVMGSGSKISFGSWYLWSSMEMFLLCSRHMPSYWTPSNEVSCCAKSICLMLWKASKCSTNEEYWAGNTSDCTPPYLTWQKRH